MVLKPLWIILQFSMNFVYDFHSLLLINSSLIFQGFYGFAQNHSPYYGFYEN